jgi:Rha family phage regulatory protein
MSNLPAVPGNGLVFTQGDAAMTHSKIVAACFEKQHFHVLEAIRNLECSEEFYETNFRAFKIKDLTGESTSHVEMTRDGFMFLAMGFTGAKAAKWKEKLIAAFNAMEAQIRAQHAPMIDVNDPRQLRRLLLDYSEKAEALTAQVEELKPAAAALDRISSTDGSLAMRDAAKTLQVPPQRFVRWLETNGWIYRRPGIQYPIAYQDKINAGMMEHKTHVVHRQDGSELVVTQPRVTSKGLAYIAKRFSEVPF